MIKLLWVAIVSLIFVLSWVIGDRLQQQDEPFQFMTYVPCQPVGVACEAIFAGEKLRLEFTPPVAVMSPFRVSVKTQADVSEIYTQFRMSNMDMGVQRYRLQNKGNGLWMADVMLPVCSLARSDWTAMLDVQYQEKWWRGEFEFAASDQL